MPPKRARRAPAPKTTAGPVTRAASKVTKPTAERAAPSKAAPKKSPKKATKTAGSKKGKEPAGSRSLTPEDPMEVDSARNPRWPAGKKDYDKFVDYSVMAAYANGANIERPPRGKKNPRWRHEGNEPLTTPELLPEGWNPNELDLYEDEIEAQITRCEERISDNIFVEMFKRRLEIYLTKRQEREDMIASEPEGLDWETVQRLNSLRIIEEHLTEQRDGDGQLPNVKAIQKAYRNREMLFIHGMISYWRKGEQIGAPGEQDKSPANI
ncbi:hypothetical protein PENANT_c020G03369 [Penicillium antarcticum]|uniref:Uncharacterized protein n=1 Tax=Penicillium antarcticum TaxID=416450 RepID=A0A1V6Q136_9EURO|nr:hypothetical protein PENANT_c020G03369 [Penicillium antarcticum]